MIRTALDVQHRARASLGRSDQALYRRAGELLRGAGARGVVADVGCGEGRLRGALAGVAGAYLGIDVVRFEAFDPAAPFYEVDLDREPLPLPDGSVDIAVALETIEHLENPRRFFRELTRITRPSGTVLVSTPNQLSLLSLGVLATRQRFAAFQDADYPSHLTALLPVDLQRMAEECRLCGVRTEYSHQGRIPASGRHYPGWLSRRFPRALSDHVFLIGRMPS